MFYSASRKGFFEKAEDAPDTVEISDSLYLELLRAPRIDVDADGIPFPADYLPPSNDELSTAIRVERNAKIAASDWTSLPDAPLTATQKAAWKTYRQALRDVTSQTTFPKSVNWPLAPK